MSSASPSKKSVLVAEDDEVLRAMLVRALSTKYEVLEAVDGLAAMEIIRGGKVPQLVITDVMMPRMNGYALARILKADPKLENIPIIFLTARTSAKDVVQGIAAGARHYIPKPFSVRDVLDRVAKILG